MTPRDPTATPPGLEATPHGPPDAAAPPPDDAPDGDELTGDELTGDELTEDELDEDGPLPSGMSRRKLVALASATALLGLGLLLALVIVLGTQTSYGRAYVRSLVLDLTRGMRGTLYIGTIEGNLFTGLTVDSLELRDLDDSVFVATGPVTVTYDPRDFVDRRILLRHLRVERPVIRMRKAEDGTWNWRRLFPSGPPRPPRLERGFGDFIVVDSADIVDGRFVLTMPWHPADSLRGARRDSAVRANLSAAQRCDTVRCWGEIRRAGDSLFTRTWHWTGGQLSLSQARIKDPDSAMRHFAIARLAIDESDPPMRLRNVRGTVRQVADSLWLDLPHFELPSSAGSATGKVVWGDKREGGTKVCQGTWAGVRFRHEEVGGCPVRYDVQVRGRRVAMEDINWVFPPLPRDGSGVMDLHIRTDPRDLHTIDYRLTNLDVRSRFSRVRGAMTFAVGGPVLVLKDVAVDAAPVDFRLLRHINQEPFPYPWAGTLTGRIVARGGPVNRWKVDSARVTFRDANVPGAITTGGGRGELDILSPAFTAFRGFAVDVERLDLRTLQFLNPEFPRINGMVQGSAVLDSSWLDVRFRDAQLAHVDGDGEPTRATGSGRVTLEEVFVRYDLDLQLAPLSLTTLARSYTMLPVRGQLAGPMRVRGTTEALEVVTDLTGAAGRLTFDGSLDSYPPGYAIRGRGRIEGLDPQRLLTSPGAPAGNLTADWTADLRGDTLTDLAGTATLAVERSLLAATRIYGGGARLTFTPGVVRVDTASVESAAATVSAAGALGLTPAHADTLRWRLTVDSLGGLRRWLTFAAPGDAPVPDDTLAGTLALRGMLFGAVDTLGLEATLEGAGLRMGATRVQRLTGRAALRDVLRHPVGTMLVRADSLSSGRAAFTSASLALDVHGLDRARFDAQVAARNGVRLAVGGVGGVVADTTHVRLDSLDLEAGRDRWRLDGPATITRSPGLTVVDELRLAGALGGRLAIGGVVPDSAAVALRVEATALPLATLGLLAQAEVPYGGRMWASLAVDGTRDDPRMTLTGALDSASFGSVTLQRVTADWRYAARLAEGRVTLLRGDRPVFTLSGTLPVDLALHPMSRRLVDDVPLALNLRSERVDLALVESFSPSLQRAQGTLDANVDVRGTWRNPALSGRAGVADGAVTLADLGVRMQRVAADVEFRDDTLVIHSVHAETDGTRRGTFDLRGGIGFADVAYPRFDLSMTARDFAVIRRTRAADVDLTTIAGQPLRLVGSARGARLTGGLEVTRADIYIPEFSTKQVQSLDDRELYSIVDTSLFTDRRLAPAAPSELVRNLSVENVQVRMGEDVWLRSTEANIKLGGAVAVDVGRDPRDENRAQLALRGQLRTERGTYRLNLGLLQRTFTVEEGGSLTFYGGADLNPELDIRALYTVRQFEQNRPDVPIRVTIGGTLAQPTLTLSSANQLLQLSQSDLISYLITGQPNLEEAAASTDAATSTAVNLGLSGLGGLLESKLSAFDFFQVQSGYNTAQAQGQRAGLGGVFSGTRVAGGWQVTDRVFVSFSYGLCYLGQQFGGSGGQARGGNNPALSLANELDNIGSRVEWRLPNKFALTASAEPSASSLVCGQAGTARGALITPRQLGLDFSKQWEF